MADLKTLPPAEPTDGERRAYYGRKLARHRGEAGLSQREAAERLGVSQPVIAKAERGIASEETFVGLARLYGIRDPYPAAPKDPVHRREWFDTRRLPSMDAAVGMLHPKAAA